LQIFNRWGDLIYKAQPYNNDWDGTATQGTILISGKVTTGTYFFILDLGNDSEPLRGSLELKRD
jgi:gliding motility-associated-like protein